MRPLCEFEDNKTTRPGQDVHDMFQFLEEHRYSVVVSKWEPIAVLALVTGGGGSCATRLMSPARVGATSLRWSHPCSNRWSERADRPPRVSATRLIVSAEWASGSTPRDA
jgi:hypothetical protein